MRISTFTGRILTQGRQLLPQPPLAIILSGGRLQGYSDVNWRLESWLEFLGKRCQPFCMHLAFFHSFGRFSLFIFFYFYTFCALFFYSRWYIYYCLVWCIHYSESRGDENKLYLCSFENNKSNPWHITVNTIYNLIINYYSLWKNSKETNKTKHYTKPGSNKFTTSSI